MRLGRPVLPREVQVVFWDGVRAGLGVEEAAGAAGAGRETARRWVVAAGGVKGNGPVAGSGRFLARWEREEIAVGLAQKLPYRRIAARLAPGRSVSTVCREVRRNGVGGVYRAHLAEREALERARRPRPAKLAVNDELREWVQAKLMGNWSPEQVSARLVLEFPDRPEMRVSAETIYQSLYVQGRGALRRELARHLRTGRQMRRPRRAAGADGRGHLKDMVNISQRPAGAADRAVPGHWEGDLIEGRAWQVADRHPGRAHDPVHDAGAAAGRQVRGGGRGGGDPGDRRFAGRAAPVADLGPGLGDGPAPADRGRRGLPDLLLRSAFAVAAALE